MKSTRKKLDAGYYLVTLSGQIGRPILRSNNERAFIISQLQDLLGRKSLLEEPAIRHRLASHIDLLAFSIVESNIQFVAFSITRNSMQAFAKCIVYRLSNYQNEWQLAPSFQRFQTDEPHITIRRLAGPHEALHHTVTLHQRHLDWEYDRYSSIGFYLNDRRGDWMHVWRLAQLYDNDQNLYRELITHSLPEVKNDRELSTALPFVPLSRAL